jgi:Domain of unknown function (DUF4062)
MEKRYQVFVSSTYADLRDERERIINELTRIGYIAVGMEQFPATDEDKFEYIKRIIEDSDYYIVIIRGKYGSVDQNGTSYTEKEFDYAVEVRKPALAFIYGDRQNLSVREIDEDTGKQEKLKSFISKLEQKRIVKHWKLVDELVSLVKDSLNDASRRLPAIGWIRGDQAIDPRVINDLESLRREAEALKKENMDLKEVLSIQRKSDSHGELLKQGDDAFGVKITVRVRGSKDKPWEREKVKLVNLTYDRILFYIADDLYRDYPEDNVKEDVKQVVSSEINFDDNNGLRDFDVTSGTVRSLRYQFEALGLITVKSERKGFLDEYEFVWRLTESGKNYVNVKRAAKRSTT